jgi:hypothetical protein
MWRTSTGERVLRGAEWKLFCEGISVVWDLVEDSEDGCDLSESGISAFDALQPRQRLALLALVGTALQDEAMPAPRLTAHTEATVAVVFEHIRQSVETEIELGSEIEPTETPQSWRDLILAAYRQAAGKEEVQLPSPSCDDFEEWNLLLECLEECILWDHDYAMGNVFLDADPAVSREEMKCMGIAEDYYLELAPDPTDEELERIRGTLRALTGKTPPAEAELVLGFEDGYHGLFVGPCKPDTLSLEGVCRFIVEIEVTDADDFDCSYTEWAELFREEVLRAALEPVEPVDPMAILSPDQLAEARCAGETGADLVLADGHRIERREGGWVIADDTGLALIDEEQCAWAAAHESDLAPLQFDSPEAAFAAYERSVALAASREERYQAAIKRLGNERTC